MQQNRVGGLGCYKQASQHRVGKKKVFTAVSEILRVGGIIVVIIVVVAKDIALYTFLEGRSGEFG